MDAETVAKLRHLQKRVRHVVEREGIHPAAASVATIAECLEELITEILKRHEKETADDCQTARIA